MLNDRFYERDSQGYILLTHQSTELAKLLLGFQAPLADAAPIVEPLKKYVLGTPTAAPLKSASLASVRPRNPVIRSNPVSPVGYRISVFLRRFYRRRARVTIINWKRSFELFALVSMEGEMNASIVAAAAVLTVWCSASLAADEVAERYIPPKAGTQATFRTIDDHGTVTTNSFVFAETTYKDKPVISISSPDGRDAIIVDKVSGSPIASTQNGKETEFFDYHPSGTRYQWPIKVGAKWTESMTYYDRKSGKSWDPVEQSWKVTAYEAVTVPAGKFMAFKLESSPGQNNATQTTSWYVPEIGGVVKRIFERTSHNYLGYAKFTTEMVTYTPAQ